MQHQEDRQRHIEQLQEHQEQNICISRADPSVTRSFLVVIQTIQTAYITPRIASTSFVGAFLYIIAYTFPNIPKHSQLTPRVYITIYVIHNSCILSSSVFVFADSSANKKILLSLSFILSFIFFVFRSFFVRFSFVFRSFFDALLLPLSEGLRTLLTEEFVLALPIHRLIKYYFYSFY